MNIKSMSPLLLLTLVACSSLLGCAANYPLSEADPQAVTVIAEGSGEATFRSILSLAKETCYKLIFDAQYYQDAKEGSIDVVTLLSDGHIKMTWLRFDIKQVNQTSEVTIIYRKKFPEFRDPALSWAKGIPAKCPV